MTNKIRIWLENYGSITLTQCNNLFYAGNEADYIKASKKLQSMFKKDLFHRYRKSNLSQVQYYSENIMAEHDLKLLDLVSEFVKNGYEIIKIYREYHIKTQHGLYIPDGLFYLKKNNKSFIFIIEIDYKSPTKKPKLDYLTQKLNSDNTIYPILIVKSECTKYSSKLINNIPVHTLPWDLNKLHLFLI